MFSIAILHNESEIVEYSLKVFMDFLKILARLFFEGVQREDVP